MAVIRYVYLDNCCVLSERQDGVTSDADARQRAVAWFIECLQRGEVELVIETEEEGEDAEPAEVLDPVLAGLEHIVSAEERKRAEDEAKRVRLEQMVHDLARRLQPLLEVPLKTGRMTITVPTVERNYEAVLTLTHQVPYAATPRVEVNITVRPGNGDKSYYYAGPFDREWLTLNELLTKCTEAVRGLIDPVAARTWLTAQRASRKASMAVPPSLRRMIDRQGANHDPENKP